MVITLYSYRLKPACLVEAKTLYLEWQNRLRSSNLISIELLESIHDPDEMILAAWYSDEEASWADKDSDEYRAWYARLAQITEEGPAVRNYLKVNCKPVRSMTD
jgi:quinol monooxygenase YgiN